MIGSKLPFKIAWINFGFRHIAVVQGVDDQEMKERLPRSRISYFILLNSETYGVYQIGEV
jgi:hypothetical protein